MDTTLTSISPPFCLRLDKVPRASSSKRLFHFIDVSLRFWAGIIDASDALFQSLRDAEKRKKKNKKAPW